MLAAMAAEVHHPLFARCFDRLSHALERELGRHRTELLVGLRGRVLELGAGNGINFGHYPAGVDEVVAVEPEPYLRARARAAAGAAPVRRPRCASCGGCCGRAASFGSSSTCEREAGRW